MAEPATSTPGPSANAAPPKSPPLAFERTPNDSLIPRISSPRVGDGARSKSPTDTIMGRLSPLSESPFDLQVIVDKQADVIRQLHKAFNAERESWDLERQRFYNRIFSLEQLLRNGEHHSPAKSPILTPTNGDSLASPQSQSRAPHATITLPTIAEVENAEPLSARRGGAPRSISLPRQSVVSFTDADGVQVEEIPLPACSTNLSPPPLMNRHMAGHTPIRATRPPTPPPQKMSFDGIEDTPTRTNTHINTYLTQSRDEEADMPLKGPLNMPELPHQPDETNFTLDALTLKLQQIEQHPDEADARPTIFNEPSPGMLSPAEPEDRRSDEISPRTEAKTNEVPFAPFATRTVSGIPQTLSGAVQAQSSNHSSHVTSPDGKPMSPQEVHEAKVQADFEQGGIRLKKKSSINFGAPFGSLVGFAGGRKASHE